MRKPLAVLPVVFGVLLLIPQAAEAQYYGGGGYGYGPQPRPQFGFRHRIHGYIGGELTGLATVGQTARDASLGNGAGGYLGHGGGGGGLFGGVRLGPFFAIELNYNITWHQAVSDAWNTYWSAFTLQTVELNGKIHIPTRGLVEPYFQIGVGGAFLGVSYDDRWAGYNDSWLLSSGIMFNVGGGLDFWLSPWFTVGGRVLYKGIRFGSATFGGSYGLDANYASIINLDVNIAIHF
jgi:hypothetical protein